MTRYKLKRNSRPKALFGSQEAAILGAAGINVAGQMAAAAINSKATTDAAKQQAQATTTAATKQANAIKAQSEKSKELQERSLEFTKEQNAENRELQKEIQLNLQMLTGQQNVNDRLQAAKIQVRNGGRISCKKPNGGYNTFLRGSNSPINMPFVVTDGGGVIPVGTTPEGFDMYEIRGNDHEHYHKTKSGKHKTGVGIKFANGKVIEGEGNQNGNQGEYVLVTPNDAMFISRHSIKGFNPAKAVNQGMNPLNAFAIQEQIKEANGITDSGKPNQKEIGGTTDVLYQASQVPNFSYDGVAPIATGVAYGSVNNMYNNKAKNGTSLRRKLKNGATTKTNMGYSWGDFAGAGINALGNLGGAWMMSSANNKAASTISAANTQAAGILADAYSQMHGIDLSNIRREDYAAAHAMPAIRAAIVDTSAQRAAQDRTLQRRLTNAKRYSMSGAAAQDRMTLAETEYNDNINKIESEADRVRESIKQENAQRITQAANENANRDTQANSAYTNAYLNALQYNNNIENQKIAGIGQANADAISQNGVAYAQALQTNGATFGNAIANTGQAFATAFDTSRKDRQDFSNVYMGLGNEDKINAAILRYKQKGDSSFIKSLLNNNAVSEEDKVKLREALK